MNQFQQKQPILIFWLTFLLLNGLLFLPAYLLNSSISTFLPQSTLPYGKGAGEWSVLFLRNNYDIFRLHVEWFITVGGLLIISLFYKPHRFQKPVKFGVFTVYWLLLSYAMYYAGSIKLYGDHPYFLNDYVLAKEVLPVFFGGMSSDVNMMYWLGGLAFILLIVLTYQLIKFLINSLLYTKGYSWHIVSLSLLLVFIGLDEVRKQYEKNSYPYAFNVVHWAMPLISKSANLKETKAVVDYGIIDEYKAFSDTTLDSLPNIYLIFIESYGATLYTSPELKTPYLDLLTEIEDSLARNEWQAVSILSESPIVGGRSWLSFTSVLTGLSIANHLQYKDLLDNHTEFPHLMRYLSNQGYQTYRLNTMIDTKITDSTFITDLNAFYDFDYWTQYRDINYQGHQYEPMFGGLPDQYAINYLQDSVYKNQAHPLFLFFITMTSHVPFYEPPPLVEDWTTLNTIDTTYKVSYDLDGSPPDRYIKSMRYELSIFTKFLTEEIEENSIVVLLGDHQPPWIANEGSEVPLHIISKHKAYLKHLNSIGFQKGMEVKDFDRVIHHKDIYQILVKMLNTQ